MFLPYSMAHHSISVETHSLKITKVNLCCIKSQGITKMKFLKLIDLLVDEAFISDIQASIRSHFQNQNTKNK